MLSELTQSALSGISRMYLTRGEGVVTQDAHGSMRNFKGKHKPGSIRPFCYIVSISGCAERLLFCLPIHIDGGRFCVAPMPLEFSVLFISTPYDLLGVVLYPFLKQQKLGIFFSLGVVKRNVFLVCTIEINNGRVCCQRILAATAVSLPGIS